MVTAERESALYLVATDDGSDPDYSTTREAGLELAKADGATVLLYDRTSESYLTDPYPIGPWSDEDDAVSEKTELDREMLENLGRHYLVEQVEAAERQGLSVRAHLARGAGVEALVDAVSRYGPDLLVLPASLNEPTLADRVRGNTLDKFRQQVGTKIKVVEPSGEVHDV
jgi:nucleotide-binding universal stress UspA family protein